VDLGVGIMIRPILACESPYVAAKLFEKAGWNIDFSQSPESGDPLVGVSLLDNAILLGVTDGYVADEQIPYIGCGIVFYLTVPREQIRHIHNKHRFLNPTDIKEQPWGDLAFEVVIGSYRFMIAAHPPK
jgi:hypothetical protein